MKKTFLVGAAMAALGPMTANEARRGRYMRDPDAHPTFDAQRQLTALTGQRTGLVAQMRDMLAAAAADGDRDLTAEEATAYDALEAQVKTIDTRLARLTGFGAAEAAGAAVIPAASRRSGPTPPPPGPGAKREFESFGEFMAAVRFSPNDQRLNYVENTSANADQGGISAEMRMDNDVQGGFMVPAQFRNTIMRVEPQSALVRPRAQVIEAGSPPDAGVTIPALDQSGSGANMYGGVEVKWIGEGEEKPETDAKLREITLVPHEVAGFVTVTDKLLRNWQAAGVFVEGLLRGAVTSAEEFAFQGGSGVHKPLGIRNASATKWVNRLNANQVQYKDLLAVVARLLMRGGSPVWSMPQSVLPQIGQLKDDLGNLIWQANARDGFAGNLLGYPVRWDNRAPAWAARVTCCWPTGRIT